MTKAKLFQYRPQRRNANKHTPRGLGLLEQSISQDGWIGAVTVAADGETFDGSARLEKAAELFGVDVEPVIVESDGKTPIIIRRTDIPNADDERAVRLALAANRVAQVDYELDVEILGQIADEMPEAMGELWTEEELLSILQIAHEFKEYDEHIVDDLSICHCPNCGHEHAAKKD